MNKNLKKLSLTFFNLLLISAFAFCTKNKSPHTDSTQHQQKLSEENSLAQNTSPNKKDYVYKIDVKKINEATHWAPKIYKATPGSKVTFEINHNLESGPAFHGFSIPALKIAKQINRGKVENVEIMIPEDFSPGQYPIKCQFHAAHHGAQLIIEKAE